MGSICDRNEAEITLGSTRDFNEFEDNNGFYKPKEI